MEKKEGKGIILKGSGRENGCQDLEESLLPLRKGCTPVTNCAPLPRSPFREAAPLPLLKQPCLQISGSRACREGAQDPAVPWPPWLSGPPRPWNTGGTSELWASCFPLCVSWYASKVWDSRVAGPQAQNSESTFMPKLVCFWEKKKKIVFYFFSNFSPCPEFRGWWHISACLTWT